MPARIQRRQQAEGRQLADRVRQRVDADAEFAQRRHLLEQLGLDPGRVQRQRRRQPADAAARDEHLHAAIQPRMAQGRNTWGARNT